MHPEATHGTGRTPDTRRPVYTLYSLTYISFCKERTLHPAGLSAGWALIFASAVPHRGSSPRGRLGVKNGLIDWLTD